MSADGCIDLENLAVFCEHGSSLVGCDDACCTRACAPDDPASCEGAPMGSTCRPFVAADAREEYCTAGIAYSGA